MQISSSFRISWAHQPENVLWGICVSQEGPAGQSMACSPLGQEADQGTYFWNRCGANCGWHHISEDQDGVAYLWPSSAWSCKDLLQETKYLIHDLGEACAKIRMAFRWGLTYSLVVLVVWLIVSNKHGEGESAFICSYPAEHMVCWN